MLIKQEIQTIQHPKYKFTVEGKKLFGKLSATKKMKYLVFFKHIPDN